MFGLFRKRQPTMDVTVDQDAIYSGGRSSTRNRWAKVIAEYPHMPNAGRSAVITTDRDLQTGPPPARIGRTKQTATYGKTSAHGNSINDAGMAFMGHVPIVHAAAIPVPRKTTDDGAFIPAVYVGNPVEA